MHPSKFLVWALTIGLMTFLSSASPAHGQVAGQPTPKELVFSALPGTKGILYKINKTPVSDPLRALGKANEKYGDDLRVICLVDNRLPIHLIGEAAAMAGKAGFKSVRTFAVDHVSGKASEVKLGPWTTEPH